MKDNFSMKIVREPDNGVQTIGKMTLLDEWGHPFYEVDTLELPEKDNEYGKSCIPKGEYEVVKHSSPHYAKCFWIHNVDGRSEILIHYGNHFFNSRGCILVGQGRGDINKDGQDDILDSQNTLAKIYEMMPNKFKLIIV